MLKFVIKTILQKLWYVTSGYYVNLYLHNKGCNAYPVAKLSNLHNQWTDVCMQRYLVHDCAFLPLAANDFSMPSQHDRLHTPLVDMDISELAELSSRIENGVLILSPPLNGEALHLHVICSNELSLCNEWAVEGNDIKAVTFYSTGWYQLHSHIDCKMLEQLECYHIYAYNESVKFAIPAGLDIRFVK